MEKILFVWDFHGVLEKDNEHAVQEICNKVLETKGLKRRISLQETIDWYGLSWSDYFRNLSPGSTELEIAEMHDKAVEFSKEIVQNYMKPMDHAVEVLSEIKKAGHVNIVLSNSRQSRLKSFLSMCKILPLLDKYIGVPENFESDQFCIKSYKVEKIKEFLKGKTFTRIVKIGDKETDICAGKQVGAITYLFQVRNSKQQKTSADYVISDLRDILKEI